jgi:UDP-N-acetylglucosamine--N-acetylmuramyl-(pentapeptide) pyrophosphoryl-undecaprenol N-acetylglucosamine transferase
MKIKQNKYVIFAGGETAGPIMPLLALAKYWQEQDSSITPVFVDRKISVAAHVVNKNGFEFKAITSGKLRRYWSFKNLLSPFQLLAGFVQSLILLRRLRPEVVIGAGGYVQVPAIVAAWFLRIPRVIHQLDVVPTFSNRLMAPFASRITTTFEKSIKDFPQGSGLQLDYSKNNKIYWTGSPCDLDSKTINSKTAKEEAIKLFKLDPEWPTVLILGGGSGATGLNDGIAFNLPSLLKTVQIIHATGKGKRVELPHDLPEVHDRYHQYEFIDRRDLAYGAADIVIARAGIATIADLAILGKVSIIVPMPNSHQEDNAALLFDQQAAVVVDQTELYELAIDKMIKKILFDIKLQKILSDNIQNVFPKDAAPKMLKVILSAINE